VSAAGEWIDQAELDALLGTTTSTDPTATLLP
jgi:hypothetical protein